ncbi:Hypothetical predicted protein [Olea europaea subsp. europaea]|uniref:Uncharacterized protein n=1 Tax=Olea europaea subsp. europaea TaxID=158383 RepID=A0A8S0RFZ2_OLEEU|nr:Hypothetical predicted protein [Olea europaea subsp. europaea]
MPVNVEYRQSNCPDGYEEDPNFIDSDNDVVSDQDDVLYDSNVTDGIEAGLDRSEREVEDELIEGNDIDVDDLEYPSKIPTGLSILYRLKLAVLSGNRSPGHIPQSFIALSRLQENTISKRVPRRKGSSSTHNSIGGPKWQFMPTPMATKETQTGNLTAGPPATLINVNVPTTEVNFEVISNELQTIDEAESVRLRVDRARKRRNDAISSEATSLHPTSRRAGAK